MVPHALHFLDVTAVINIVSGPMVFIRYKVSMFLRVMGLFKRGHQLALSAWQMAVAVWPFYCTKTFWIWKNLMHSWYDNKEYHEVLHQCEFYADPCLSSGNILLEMSEEEHFDAGYRVLSHRNSCLYRLRRYNDQKTVLKILHARFREKGVQKLVESRLNRKWPSKRLNIPT